MTDEEIYAAQLRRDGGRRDELNRQARGGRNSSDPTERARWVARDEVWARSI